MQLRHVLTTLLYAICCAEGVAGRQAGLRKRQDSTDVATTAPPNSTPPPQSSAATTNAPPPSSAQSSPTSQAPQSQASSQAQPSTFSSVTSTTQDASPSKTGAAAKASETATNQDQLPIHPTITPAIALMGVILMGTGIAFCLIGIKHQWLHVYLSAAYSTSLGVAVLIIYVMTPPISNAIQGAYFVAAVVTGLIFGAFSLVFKDVTEGLGCLIGGFCLAMWFMVLRPGGLVQSGPGPAILIGVFSVAGFSLSFSQYTRNYGLIFCTSFAGAMITVLGIDCFSRAGLKEFWLYIWNLNDNIFPLGTNTYPITRGIRVEIAVTVIIFLFGVMSQLKIWKIVKERRDKKEAERLAEDESRDQLAGEVGQDVEALNKAQREQWEALYGDGQKVQQNADSGVGTSVGSTHKKSASVTTREVDAIEMDENPRTIHRSGSKLSEVPSGSVIDEDLERGESESRRADSAEWSSQAGSRKSTASFGMADAEAEEPAQVQQPGGPEVVPLPFSPPQPAEHDEEDPAKSDAADSKKSAHTAVTSLNPRALAQHNERMQSQLPRIEDDRASSIAATADDEPEVDGDSIHRRSIVRPSVRTRPTQTPAIEIEDSSAPRNSLFPEDNRSKDRSLSPAARRSWIEPAVEDEDDEELVRPETAQEVEIPVPARATSAAKLRRISSASSRRRSTGSRGSDAAAGNDEADAGSAVGSLTGHLPEAISKIAMAYRTNEWAKHIADADQPDDLPQEPDSPGIQVDHAFREEAARPVDTKALSEVAVATPLDGPRKSTSKSSRRESKNPYRQSSTGKAPSMNRASSTPVYSTQRSNSRTSLRPQGSNDQLRRDMRSPSATPLDQPLMESPIEEIAEHFVTPMTSTNNLLDQRNDRLKRKTTTTNFNALHVGAAEDGPAIRVESMTMSPPANMINDNSADVGEEMTLAQRRALIQQQQQQQQQQISPAPSPNPQLSRRTSGGSTATAQVLNRTHSTNNPHLIYDSHQPMRGPTVDPRKQSAMYSQWRSSLQQGIGADAPGATGVVDHAARQQMLSQREAEAQERARRQERRAERESRMDIAMRTGQLAGAHADVLRRMQAKANENAQ